MGNAVAISDRRYRKQIPAAHQVSLDTRIRWLWHQRFGTIQMVWKDSKDVLDNTAATLFLQAIISHDLESISQIFSRLEGGAIPDKELLEREESMRI